MAQTATEWVMSVVNDLIPSADLENVKKLLEHAKSIEKQNITKAFYDGMVENSQPHMGKAEQYYHKIYKK